MPDPTTDPTNGGDGPPGNPPAAPPRPARRDAFKGVEFIAEVDDGNGGRLNLQCRPRVGKLVRGRFDRSKMNVNIVGRDLASLPPVIPGIMIVVKGGERRVTLVDPLSWKANLAIKDRLAKAIKDYSGQDQGPDRQYDFADLQDDDFVSWLYWMRRHLDAKQIVVHRGRVPEMREIRALPGRIRYQPHDKSPPGKNGKLVEFEGSGLPYLKPGGEQAELDAKMTPSYEEDLAALVGPLE